jgi:hypothetical protein
MTRYGHGGVRLPSVGSWVVTFHLPKHGLLSWPIDDAAFTTHGIKAITVNNQAMA